MSYMKQVTCHGTLTNEVKIDTNKLIKANKKSNQAKLNKKIYGCAVFLVQIELKRMYSNFII